LSILFSQFVKLIYQQNGGGEVPFIRSATNPTLRALSPPKISGLHAEHLQFSFGCHPLDEGLRAICGSEPEQPRNLHKTGCEQVQQIPARIRSGLLRLDACECPRGWSAYPSRLSREGADITSSSANPLALIIDRPVWCP
jgi:hypothetical protein